MRRRQNHGQLTKSLAVQLDDLEQSLARSALIWLCIAQRPLRAHELWIAMQLEPLQDAKLIEQLVSGSQSLDDKQAAANLKDLLGDAVTTQPEDSNESKILVACADQGLFTMRGHLHDQNGVHPRLSFSSSEAHLVSANACMTLCSATTLHLANVHEESIVSPLVMYAWTYWRTHLSLSGHQLSDQAVAECFNTMVHRVCIDASVFLLGLNAFFTSPIGLSATENHRDCFASILEVQTALECLNIALADLVQDHDHSTALSTAYTLGHGARPPVLLCADIARGLGRICVALSLTPIYEAFLEQYDNNSSPFDVLAHLTSWMEAVASYPKWKELSESQRLDAFDISNPSAPGSNVAQRIRQRRTKMVSDEPLPQDNKEKRLAAVTKIKKPPGVSSTRWFISGIIYKIGPLTASGLQSQPQPSSSFAAVPLYMYSFDPPIPLLQRFIPSLRHHPSSLPSSSMRNHWSRTKPALLSDGPGVALLHCGAAVLAHHVRRMLVPWLGAWVRDDPLEDLRMARGNPDFFLDEALAVPSCARLALMHLQKWAFDLAAALLVRLVTAANGRVPPRLLRATGLSPLLLERGMSVAKVCYLAWTLAAAEYMFARTLSALAFALAFAKLGPLSPAGSANRAALALVLRKHPAGAALSACQVVLYTTYGIVPTALGAVACAARGRPGLLVVLGALGGGVWSVLRYRARLFILLEMSSMFVVIGCVAVLFGLLALEVLADPLGVRVSAARARSSAEVLRRALPPGAEERIEILRRKPLVHEARQEEASSQSKSAADTRML